MKRELQKRRLTPAVLLLLLPCTSLATEVNDSVVTYQNQTVSTKVKVHSQGILNVQNDSVTSSGILKLSAESLINITGPFVVQLGGILELNGGREHFIRFTYDAAGNRISRIKDY